MTEHPAELVERAEALERDAEQQMAVVRGMRAEAARLRERAARANDPGRGVSVARPARNRGHDDPLLTAAALAVEDLAGVWRLDDVAQLIALRDMGRVAAITSALCEMGHVERSEGGYRSLDPEMTRVRDAVIELGEFTREQLAEHLGVHPEALTWYLGELLAKGILDEEDGELAYVPTGPERAITSRPRHRPPELDPPAGLDAPRRGEPVRIVDHSQAAKDPSSRHRFLLRQKRHEQQEAAKAERAERQRARARG